MTLGKQSALKTLGDLGGGEAISFKALKGIVQFRWGYERLDDEGARRLIDEGFKPVICKKKDSDDGLVYNDTLNLGDILWFRAD